MIGRIFLKRSLEAPAPFIVGAGRSGTTLLRAMLNAHPDLSIPPETGFIPALARLRGPKDRLRDLFIRAVTDFETVRIVDFPKEEFSRRIHAIKDFDIAAGVRAFYRMYADQSHKKRWGDKTPSYGLQMRTIERLLPEAHFIHLIRDGRDVALSTKGLWWAPGRDMAALAVHWRDTVQTIRKHGPRCRRYLEVRYEELVRDTTATLMKICDFIALPYDASMEKYHETTARYLDEIKSVYDGSGRLIVSKEDRLFAHRFLTKPPEVTRIGRWQNEMSRDDRRGFEEKAGRLLRELGYPDGSG